MNDKPGRDPREEDRPHEDRPESGRTRYDRPEDDQPHEDLPEGDQHHDERPVGGQPQGERPEGDQPANEQSEEARRALASYSSMPKWMFSGLIIGGGFGVIMDNMPLGVGAGLAIGALIGFFRNGSKQP